MAPKIGVQTIIWGFGQLDLSEVLGQIRAIGYEGVEFAQPPNHLGDPLELERLLQGPTEEEALTFLGLAGGLSLRDRVTFCDRMTEKPLYLYVQDWDRDQAPAAMAAGYTLALHPHQFAPVDRFGAAQPLLQSHPELKFLPDTAHLWLAGDNVLEVLERMRERIVAVHLKDWRPEYGRSFATFSKGFTELGTGIIELRPIWRWLEEHFDGWVVVEQDWTVRSPLESLRTSWDWLHGSSGASESHYVPSPIQALPRASEPFEALQDAGARAVRILDVMNRDSSQGLERLYATLAESFGTLLDACFCSAWEVSPGTDTMTLQAFWPPESSQKPTTTELSVPDCVSGEAVLARTIRHFDDIRAEVRRGRFPDAGLAKSLRIESMISIPVLNRYNINQPELVVNVFHSHHPELVDLPLLEGLAAHVAIAVEGVWSDMRARIAEEINHVAAACSTVRQLLVRFRERVAMYTRCRGVSVFLVDPIGDRLELAETSGLEGDDEDQPDVVYQKREDDGLPGRCWALNHVIISHKAKEDERDDPRAKEKTGEQTHAVMVAPIRNTLGEVMGVVRCRGKLGHSPGTSSHFSATDEIVLTALQAALSPHLQLILAAERRSQGMTRIIHELRMPIVVTLGAADFIRYEMRRNHWEFAEDYLADIEGYMELMRGLVNKARFLRPEMPPTRTQRILLYRDIIVPAVRQVRVLLIEKRFSPRGIECAGMKNVPAVFVEKARFQQIFFNLLNNAIKYAYDDPTAFRVEISYRHRGGGFEIVFRDWGHGIEDDMEEAIFSEGVRGREAYVQNIAGDGFGCFLVRELVLAHGGTIRLTCNRFPTEFTLFLPSSLQRPSVLPSP
jgi:signal transduction histidine kinase/sugar phosphate isomerase/epimerase